MEDIKKRIELLEKEIELLTKVKELREAIDKYNRVPYVPYVPPYPWVTSPSTGVPNTYPKIWYGSVTSTDGTVGIKAN